MASTRDATLTEVLKQWVTPLLKPLGFKKRGHVYELELSGLSWLIDVQRSKWNDVTEAQFTLNCGVYIAGVVAAYARSVESAHPRLEDCCVSARIGLLNDSRKDHWWRLRMGDHVGANEEIGTDVQARLRQDALPFLRKFESVGAVAKFLEGSQRDYDFVIPQSRAQRLAYAAIIYWLLGEAEKSAPNLRAAAKAAEGSPLQDIILRLRTKIDENP